MKTRLLLFCLLAFFSFTVDAVQPVPAPQGSLFTNTDIYFIAVCLAVLGAGWITFS